MMVSSFLWYTCTEKLGLLPTGVEQKRYNPLITHKCSSFKGQNKFTKYSSFHWLKNIKQNLWNNIFTFTYNCYNLPLTFAKSNLSLYWTHSCFLMTSQNAEKIYCLTQKGVSLKLKMKVQKWEICTVLEIPREASVNYVLFCKSILTSVCIDGSGQKDSGTGQCPDGGEDLI